MEFVKRGLLFIFVFPMIIWGEDLSGLLQLYKKEADLSHITKRESAGNLTLFTRDDLEKMQVHSLIDILRIVPGFYIYRGANGLTLMEPPTLSSVPVTAIRLYINDHDMTSSSFGSAMLIWGHMPIEYIDHIEVYKTSSSIDFGNETGILVIRLYTKEPSRDSGSKVRLLADQKASYDLNLYNSDVLQNDFSYFVFANGNDYKKEPYHNYYDGEKYTFRDDRQGYSLYANLQYKKSKLEVGKLHKKNDSFLGIGMHKTPTGGDLHADHFYAHFTQQFDYDVQMQLAYDKLGYERSYIDPNGISISNPTSQSGRSIVNDYDILFKDEIYTAILEKKIHLDRHSMTFGAFYKYKKMEQRGRYDALSIPNEVNGFDLYSIYGEERYDFDRSTRFTFMAKGDFYRYKKVVDSADELVARVGVTKDIDRFRLKLFYTDTYLPNSFYSLYNPSNVPFAANPHLKHAQVKMSSISVGISKHNGI